jgi:hypothetical protein
MAQIETIGGGVSFTPDGKKITKQVYVLTEGTTTVSPDNVSGATITSADFIDIEAGSRRVVVTWTEGQAGAGGGGSGGGTSAAGGTTVELVGGSREVPIGGHPRFQFLTDAQKNEIKRAIDNKEEPDTAIVPTEISNPARILYKLLLRGTEYYFAPGVSYRETTIETQLPSLRELCSINAPRRAPTVGLDQNWLLTSINARTVARPTGGVVYEVSREWTMSDLNGWDADNDGIYYRSY